MALAGLLAGCSGGNDLDKATTEWFHAHLTTEDGQEIPFFLGLPEDCNLETATIVNGRERNGTDCRKIESHLRIDFPVYGTLIEAERQPDGTLSGHWSRDMPYGRVRVLPFEAQPVSEVVPALRFPRAREEVPPSLDVTGDWQMEFEEHGIAKGVFEQDPSGVVKGTIEAPSEYGDLRFLAGNVRADGMYLSTFDGQHALLLKGRMSADGTMVGELIYGEGPRDQFVARRVDEVELPDPLDRVQLTATETKLDIEALRDPRYEGKAIIVEVFGTWCPNCNDLAPVLAELLLKHRDEGLEVLGLAFEINDDEDYVERRLREYNASHDLDWDVVIGGTIEDLAAGGPPWLSGIDGVPVTIFVERDRTVHAIYTGFSGPATGEAHRQAIAELQKLTAEILDDR